MHILNLFVSYVTDSKVWQFHAYIKLHVYELKYIPNFSYVKINLNQFECYRPCNNQGVKSIYG